VELWRFVSLIQVLVNLLELDITVTIQDRDTKLVIGLVANG